MLKSIIVAKTQNHAIGKDQQLLCHLPDDLQYFRQTTMGHHVIVGRKTFNAIGKPLPGRQLIVVTRNLHYKAPGCIVVHSIAAALSAAKQAGETEVFIAGGEAIYQATIALADKMYLTAIKANLAGDTFFPAWDVQEWREIKRVHHAADAKHAYAFDFVTLLRRSVHP